MNIREAEVALRLRFVYLIGSPPGSEIFVIKGFTPTSVLLARLRHSLLRLHIKSSGTRNQVATCLGTDPRYKQGNDQS